MNVCLGLILIVVASVSIPVHSYSHLNEDMNKVSVKKTKDGWQCGGIMCPKKFTAYCTVTKILQPTEKVHTELLILCMDKNNKAKCGITRTRKGVIRKLLEVDEDGNTQYALVESISVEDGTRIPRCPFVPPIRS
ncbi:hypothetical protein KR084_005983 [Drosophila pseudotakahashii]|nr:hypothetical protein KR084_005983 [Drosophila pseudotakahashii]